MKKIYTVLILIAAFFAASAQTVDLEILGFVDANGNPISSIVMNSTQDLQPRVNLKNNGFDVVPATDSVIFDITYNQGYHVTYLILRGAQLQSVGPGDEVIVDLDHPIWTASTMNEYSLIACTICYEVRIAGTATDPVSSNNSACINVTRELDIDEMAASSVMLFPNPAAASVSFTGMENVRVQIFDLSGKMLSSVKNVSENQQIDISFLAEGLYIVRIFDGKNSVTKKLNVIR